MKQFTEEEDNLIIEKYPVNGSMDLVAVLGRSRFAISKRAKRLGLGIGAGKSNYLRRNKWEFKEWSYKLGYIIGVYLGDGNIWMGNEEKRNVAYFRLSVTDQDFALATQQFLKDITGYDSSITWRVRENKQCKPQCTVTLCNLDFARWMTNLCGKAKEKVIPDNLPDVCLVGVLEGLMDSEGTATDYGVLIRMNTDLSPLLDIFKRLDIQRLTPRGHRIGSPIIRMRKDSISNRGIPLNCVNLSYKELFRAGCGTYIERKSTALYVFKTNKDNTPRDL